jgi:hypothetical protein
VLGFIFRLFYFDHRYYELAHSIQEDIHQQPSYLNAPDGASLREYQVKNSVIGDETCIFQSFGPKFWFLKE